MLPLDIKVRMPFFILKYLINSKAECIIEHSRDQTLQQWRRLLDARIGVDLDEPRIALVVEHEIIAEYFEAVTSFMLIDLLFYT